MIQWQVDICKCQLMMFGCNEIFVMYVFEYFEYVCIKYFLGVNLVFYYVLLCLFEVYCYVQLCFVWIEKG